MFILLLPHAHTHTPLLRTQLTVRENQTTTRGQQDSGFAYAFWLAEFTMV